MLPVETVPDDAAEAAKQKVAKVVLFDVDGVLADFLSAFYREAKCIDISVNVAFAHTNKSWHEFNSISKEVVAATWEKIKSTPCWWMSLKPFLCKQTLERINLLHIRHEVYFVTSRIRTVGESVQYQTKFWLHEQGIYHAAVISTPKKGDIAKAVKADFSIDDKWENAQCVHWLTEGATKSYLLNRPYNQVEAGVGSRRVVRVNTAEEYLDVIEKS